MSQNNSPNHADFEAVFERRIRQDGDTKIDEMRPIEISQDSDSVSGRAVRR